MIEPLRAANEIAGQDRFGWQLISEDGARIPASAGVYFDPDVKLADAESLDFMFCLSEPKFRKIISPFSPEDSGWKINP